MTKRCGKTGGDRRRHVAELVLEADDLLLHDDDDFEAIKAVRPLRTLRG